MDTTQITERLQRWATAFNARDAAGTCELFARDLISTAPGAVEVGREAVCAQLKTLLAKPEPQLRYHVDIREIIISGDIGIARLFWTLTTGKGAKTDVSREAGIDIFERQPDGRWSIARFIAFTVPPER